jgi:prefoldin alpha subunit
MKAQVLEPDKILLNIGSDVIVERSNKEAVEFLKDRIIEMEASEKKVAEALDRLRGQMNDIAKRIEQEYQLTVQAERAAKPQPVRNNQDE